MQGIKSDSKLFRFLRVLDAFSMPFQFCLYGVSKTHKTHLGGVLTLIVYSVSLVYFVYLSNLYFSTGYQPKVSIIEVTADREPFRISNQIMAFNFFIKDEGNIQEYERKTQKKYLNFIVKYQYYDEEGVRQELKTNAIPCSESNLTQYMCVDFSKLPSKIIFQYNQSSSSIYQAGFQILIVKCVGQSECASDPEINNIIFNVYNRLQISTQLVRYNTLKYENEVVSRIDSYGLDENIAMRHQFWLIKSKTTLINGFILQSRTQEEYLDSIEEISEVRSVKSLQEQTGIPLIGQIMINMSQRYKAITIQFPLYTETFAQFMSVFTVLLVIGKLGSNCSELEIYQELTNMYIKNYYKQTGINYLQNDGQQKKQQNEDIELRHSNLNKQEIDTKNLIQINQKLNDTYLPLILFKRMSFSIFQKLQIIFFKEIPKKIINSKREQLGVILDVIKHTHKSINLISFFNEILQLKLMMRLLFTKEQYSAIKFCGLDIEKSSQKEGEMNNLDEQINEDVQQNTQQQKYLINEKEITQEVKVEQGQIKQNKDPSQIPVHSLTHSDSEQHSLTNKFPRLNNNQLNHLEMLEKIDQNEELSHYYFQKYLQTISNNTNQRQLSLVDQRILDCIVESNVSNKKSD